MYLFMFIISLFNYLLGTHYAPGTILGSQIQYRIRQSLCPYGVYIFLMEGEGETEKLQVVNFQRCARMLACPTT